MKLAASEITIRIDGETVFLRPTLLAATRLERRYGFPRMLEAVAEGNLTIMADIIRESGGHRSALPHILHSVAAMPLRSGMEALTPALLAHVANLAGIDPEEEKASSIGERITFDDYHSRLYRIATGWLGWPPEVAWNATPAEITEAHAGRVEMLKAVFGSSASDDPEAQLNHSPDDVAHGLATLRTIVAMGGGVAS